jgi:hypothetical protein
MKYIITIAFVLSGCYSMEICRESNRDKPCMGAEINVRKTDPESKKQNYEYDVVPVIKLPF